MKLSLLFYIYIRQTVIAWILQRLLRLWFWRLLSSHNHWVYCWLIRFQSIISDNSNFCDHQLIIFTVVMILVARIIYGKYEIVKDSCPCVVKNQKILTYAPRLVMQYHNIWTRGNMNIRECPQGLNSIQDIMYIRLKYSV